MDTKPAPKLVFPATREQIQAAIAAELKAKRLGLPPPPPEKPVR